MSAGPGRGRCRTWARCAGQEGEDGNRDLSGPQRGRGCWSRGSSHQSRRGVRRSRHLTPIGDEAGGAAPTERRGLGGADGRPWGPGGGRGPQVCPRVSACARARTSLCGEAARRCLRVPGACARGCLAPCLCRCLGVSGESACARSARAPGLGGALLGVGTAGCWAGGCFSLGNRDAGG